MAKSFGVSENNIRRMEAAGLLTPAFVSDKSGYRYYDIDNIFRISTILSLKLFGFIYDDIREHFEHPGDYTELYDKLVEKQKEINLLVEKMSRHLKNTDLYKCEILDYAETYCLTKKVFMLPTLERISEVTKQFTYEAVEKKYPINFAKAILILTECTNYREYKQDCEQELTFCIPLRGAVEGADIQYLPPCKTVSFTWSFPAQNFSTVVPVIDNLFASHGLVQSDTLRATYDIGVYLGKEVSVKDTVMHILVPV